MPPPEMMSSFLSMVDGFIAELRAATHDDDLKQLMDFVAREIGCRYWALIHHGDLRRSAGTLVDLKNYPEAICHRLIHEGRYRRDPVIKACLFSGCAFLWSEMAEIIDLDRRDRASLEYGLREGLNEGITVPYVRLGECVGSCTFAGMAQPARAQRHLGLVQMIGVFAFQAARRLLGTPSKPMAGPGLHPRPRDCVVLAGRGYSNKQIARALSLTPRTVDGYLTEARRLFGAHDRTELVIGAVLAGEVGLHELKPGQPG
jgi:LuxR family quorum-sensing system transcriptional regulator CciR